MKIDKYQYPVIIIAALVIFTILGFALGFLPEHDGGDKHNLLIPAIDFVSMSFG